MAALAEQHAATGMQVFPLKGKAPAIKTAHPKGDPLHGACKGECGREGHGLYDATRDLTIVRRWWREHPGANIGIRPPRNGLVVDIDPRHGGADAMTAVVAEHGPLPATLTTISGRGDGGRHKYFTVPPGMPYSSAGFKKYGDGIDVKGNGGYIVAAGSIHPDTGRPYVLQDGPRRPAPAPDWLLTLLAPPAPPQRPERRVIALHNGPSIADEFSSRASWNDILGPHGWRRIGGDGDGDGSRWLHPAATSSVSATIRHGLLFCYSPNTPLPMTEAGNPAGVTRFRAFALLEHHGDLSAAARALRDYVKAAA